MHVRRGFLGWGIFLILAGAIPLAVRAGYITDDQLGRFWTLWPLILVGVGLGLILARTRFGFVGGLVVAATVGIMVGGLLSAGVVGLSGGSCGSDPATAPFAARDGAIEGAGEVKLQLDCGDLTIATAQGSSWHLEGTDTKGAGPDVESSASSLDIRTHDSNGASFLGFGARDTWRLTLPTSAQLGLDLQLNAGRGTVALGGATLTDLKLQMNAGSATIDLGSAAAIRAVDLQLNAGSLGLTLPNLSMTGTIQANAGAVTICAPPGAGLRLHTGESVLASYDYAGHGLVQDGKTWTTPGFESATVRIELETNANAGSFSLDPEDGCG